MGERTVRIRKVKGSNPSVSTNVELYEHNTAKSVFILLRRASYSSPHFRVGDNTNRSQVIWLRFFFMYAQVVFDSSNFPYAYRNNLPNPRKILELLIDYYERSEGK